MINDEINLSFLAGVQVKNDIYFSAWNMNGLFKYNPQTEICDFLRVFAEEGKYGLHSQAILYNDTIWFIPSASERISIVDINTLDITYLDLPQSGYRIDGEPLQTLRIKGCYRTGEKYLWLVPHMYKLFIKVDMERREIVKFEQWIDDGNAGSNGIKIKDKLVVYRHDLAEICIIDDNLGTIVTRILANKKVIYKGIEIIGDWIYFFPLWLKDGILLLNREMNEIKYIQLEDDKQMYDECQIYVENGDILLVPYIGNKCTRIGVENEKCFVRECRVLDVAQNTYCSKKLIYNDETWFLPHLPEKPIICLKKQEDGINYRYITISKKKFIDNAVQSIIRYGNEYSPLSFWQIINEQDVSLKSFLQFGKKLRWGEGIKKKNNVGVNIYKTIESN